jgi:shikimate kinase
MNIVLIGYRGTGKSVVGRLLARRLAMTYLGMDAEIVRRAGMPVPEIVANEGWPGFRDRESALARELGEQDGIVIDTGGGVIERPENIETLQKNGCVIWLKAKVSTIVARIQGDTQRPSLTAGKTFTEEVAEVLERRTPLYRSAARHVIDTDPLTPEQIVGKIIALWENETKKL